MIDRENLSCILCNIEVILTAHKKVKTDYTRPDNVTSHKLMERLNIIADKRISIDNNDKWAVEVKGRLSGINDLVAEEAIAPCISKFMKKEDNNHRKVSDQ